MKNLLTSLIFLVMVFVAGSAQAQSAETETLVNIFGCNYNEGMTVADSKASSELFMDAIAKIGSPELSAMNSFLWWPHVGGTEFDSIWFDYHANLNAYGKATDAYWESEYVAGIEAIFADVATCTSSLHFHRQVYAGGEVDVNPPAAIHAVRCTFNEGMGMDDVEDALEDWSAIHRDLGTTNMNVFMLTPSVGNSQFDVSYFWVFDNWSELAATQTNYLTSREGQRMDERWFEIHRCQNSLWNGERIIPPV